MDSNKQHENEGVGKKKDNDDNNPQLRRYIAAHAWPSLAAAPKTHIVLQFYQFETSRQELGDVTVVLPSVQLAGWKFRFMLSSGERCRAETFSANAASPNESRLWHP